MQKIWKHYRYSTGTYAVSPVYLKGFLSIILSIRPKRRSQSSSSTSGRRRRRGWGAWWSPASSLSLAPSPGPTCTSRSASPGPAVRPSRVTSGRASLNHIPGSVADPDPSTDPVFFCRIQKLAAWIRNQI